MRFIIIFHSNFEIFFFKIVENMMSYMLSIQVGNSQEHLNRHPNTSTAQRFFLHHFDQASKKYFEYILDLKF